MAGRARRQAGRHRRAGARSSARHVPRSARTGSGAAASRCRIFRRDRPPHHRGFPVLGAGAQDHDDQRHSRHREHQRRYRQDHRPALHLLCVPWRWPEGEGCALRVVAVHRSASRRFRFETGGGNADDFRTAAQSAVAVRRQGQGRDHHRRLGHVRPRHRAGAHRARRQGAAAPRARKSELDEVATRCANLAASRHRRAPAGQPGRRRGDAQRRRSPHSARSISSSSPRASTSPASSRNWTTRIGRR